MSLLKLGVGSCLCMADLICFDRESSTTSTPTAEDTTYVQEMLLDYAAGIAVELNRAREKLRRAGRAENARDEARQ